MNNIHFFSEDTKFQLRQKTVVRQWIVESARAEGFKVGEISIIFCSDNYLLEINRQYLNHDTFTDIVTFDHSEQEALLMGDIFISIDRVRENAPKFGVSQTDELHRVLIHGILHLCGYGDKGKKEKALMTEKEDFYLAQRVFLKGGKAGP